MLQTIDSSHLSVPWLYREEITMDPGMNERFFLDTNGISSKADLYFNGQQLASKETLRGAYGGQRFEITPYVRDGLNTVLIRAYPTNYLKDFALGWVDWNPYPPDNGTGVWREVTISQTGFILLLDPRVTTDYKGEPSSKPVKVTIHVLVRNTGPSIIQGRLEGTVKEQDGTLQLPISAPYTVNAGQSKTIALEASINDPKIWWPKLWGSQSLYTLDLAAFTGPSHILSDQKNRTFGIRHVISKLNAYNDTSFIVNGHFFHVRGAGYSPDMFLRFDRDKLTKQFSLMLDMGLNTVRLEGKQEQPAFYDIADRMGMMVLAGWECCDKWEGWDYNEDGMGEKWADVDYATAGLQMEHEAYMMQGHACMLAFLVGSDYWPNDRATKIYMDRLKELNWDVPIIASAGMLGWPEILGPSGMKMGMFNLPRHPLLSTDSNDFLSFCKANL